MICSKCRATEALVDFVWCASCRKRYDAERYRAKKAQLSAQKKIRRKALRSSLKELKNKPCMDCGGSFPSYVMQFDHRRDKEFEIGNAILKGYGLERVMREVAKCDLVCANCHAIRTYTARRQRVQPAS